MAGTAVHTCPQSTRLLRLTSPLHSSKHSCFLSGNALHIASHQCPSANAVRQVKPCRQLQAPPCIPCKEEPHVRLYCCYLQTTMMSRYRGPRLRIVRRLGSLPGLTQKSPSESRKAPPGQHGAAAKKPSQYGVRLMEKQKLRFNYGVTEHQLINYVKKARYVLACHVAGVDCFA